MRLHMMSLVSGDRAKVQAGGTQFLGDGRIATYWTLNQASLTLRNKVKFRGKPTFKDMKLAAMKIENFHADTISQYLLQ